MQEQTKNFSLGKTAPLLLFLMAAMPLAALFAMQEKLVFLIAGIVVLPVAAAILRKPEWAALSFVFVFYTNAAVVAYKFHGVPKVAAAVLPGVLVVPLIYHVFIRKQRFIVDRAFLLIIVFLTTQLLSAFFAKDAELALGNVGALAVEGVALYFLIINGIRGYETLRRVVWMALIACAFMGGISVVQELTKSYSNNFGGFAQRKAEVDFDEVDLEAYSSARRAYGPIGEQNRYAQVLVVMLPLCLYLFHTSRSRRRRIAVLSVTFLTTAGVILTFSRSTFIIMVLILGLITWLRYLKPKLVFGGGLALMLVLAITMPEYFQRISSVVNIPKLFAEKTEVRSIDSSFRGRFSENLAAISAFFDHPAVGVGPGNFPVYYVRQYGNALGLKFLRGNRRAHNLYLEIAADSGVLGIGAFLAIAFTLLWQLWQQRRRWLTLNPDFANLATAMFLCVMTYLGTGIFLHLSYQRYYWFLIALAGTTVWVLRHQDESSETARSARNFPFEGDSRHSRQAKTRSVGNSPLQGGQGGVKTS